MISLKNLLRRYLFPLNLIRKIENMSTVVTTEQGKLEGEVKSLPYGGNYLSFKGIPYAAPPIGELRFKAPLPPRSWEGIRCAKAHGPICPQWDIFTSLFTEGDENCLHLNVYTPSKINKPLPVMIFIHGGAYYSGSGDSDQYGPEFLVAHEVVLVTINYRLEVFGFLCLDTPDVPGNAGLKDQVAAFRWVKRNIQRFGGDPDNVTIFGESAGAAAVTLHLTSPMSKGLFNKAIAQSGVFLNYWSYVPNGKEYAYRLANYFGIETTDPREIANELRKMPPKNFLKTTFKVMTEFDKKTGIPIVFSPVVEKQFDGVESFLTEDPVKILQEGRITDVPVICGYNSGEGMMFLSHNLKKRDLFNENFYYKLPRHLISKAPLHKAIQMGQRLREFYFGECELSEDTKNKILSLETDVAFMYGIHKFAEIYSQVKNGPVYLYEFDYTSERDLLRNLFAPELKLSCHADDLLYFFHTNALDVPEKNSKTGQFIHNITKLWTDFAKSGYPTLDNNVWKPYEINEKNIFILSDKMRLASDAHKERIKFCDELYNEVDFFNINQQSKL